MMGASSIAWAVALALYLLEFLRLWIEGGELIRQARLSPKRRRAERVGLWWCALLWPVFVAVDLCLRVVTSDAASARGWR